jgi:hypothetical protein
MMLTIGPALVSELGTAFEVVENILFNSLILPLRAAKLPTE